MLKLILSLLIVFFTILNVESSSLLSSSSSTSTNYLYSILTDAEYRSNQVIAILDISTGEVVRNSTFHSMKQILSIVSVNETENTMLIFATTPANNNSIQLVQLNMTTLTFSLVGQKVDDISIHFMSVAQPYEFVNNVIYSFGQDEGDKKLFFSVQSWNFNTGKWNIYPIQVSNFIENPTSMVYPIGVYNPTDKLMYTTYQSTEDGIVTCIAAFDPLKGGVVSNQYNNISGVMLGIIKYTFVDNVGQMYAIQSITFAGISICKFNFESLTCVEQISITLGQDYQVYGYSPFLQSADLSRFIILSPSSESTNEKPVFQMLNYEISTWKLLSSASTPNVWTGNNNGFDFETLFISN